MSAERREQADDAPLAPQAYSIDGFCAAHDISPTTYFKLKAEGSAPDEMRVGRRVRISVEAAARWRAEREAQRAAEERKGRKGQWNRNPRPYK